MELSVLFGFFNTVYSHPLIQQLPLPGRKRYWKENHWHWNLLKTTLEGRFRTPYCAPKGRLVKNKDGTFDFFIYDPPEKLWTHPLKKYCFTPTPGKEGEYLIHFRPPKKNLTIDGCIMEVERTLVEAFEPRR
jgi:hypothetical protein